MSALVAKARAERAAFFNRSQSHSRAFEQAYWLCCTEANAQRMIAAANYSILSACIFALVAGLQYRRIYLLE